MPQITKKTMYFIAAPFLLFYTGLLIWNIFRHSNFFIDNVIALVFLCIVIFFYRWLKIDTIGFILLNIAWLMHNGGSFGFYSLTWGIWAYDNVVHFISSFAAAYIVFNLITNKMHIRKNKIRRETVIDEHKFLFIFIVIGCVAFLGSIVEIVEFAGFMIFEEQRNVGGLLNTDAEGDWCNKNYVDTLTDIIINTIGSICGILVYYQYKYKKKSWLHY